MIQIINLAGITPSVSLDCVRDQTGGHKVKQGQNSTSPSVSTWFLCYLCFLKRKTPLQHQLVHRRTAEVVILFPQGSVYLQDA